MRLILSEWFFFEKMWKNMEKRQFFRAAMAGLGKYRIGGYGRIGVYRVNIKCLYMFYFMSWLVDYNQACK